MTEHETSISEKRACLDFLCESLHAVTRLSIFLFDENLECIFSRSKWENHLKNFFFLNCPFDPETLLHTKDRTTLYFSDSLHLNWFLVPVTEDHTFYVLGPAFETDVTPSFFQKEMEFQKMSVSSRIHFLEMLKDIPVIPNVQFCRYVSILYYGLYHDCFDFQQFRNAATMMHNSHPASVTDSGLSPHIPESHGSRLLEKVMLENVRTGNIAAPLLVASSVPNDMTVGTLAINDPLRQAKNAIITQTSLVTRAAVDGGMDAEAAFSMSDSYIQQIELCTAPDEVYAVSTDMYQSFIKRVHDARTSCYTPLTSYICTYIDKHIFEKISLNSLADGLGYDTYYLTTIFRKDTGCTIKQYILEKKVAQAKILLESTLMEVQEISDRLAFQSASYFCTQFKKIAGESPLSYRKNRNNKI